MMNRRNFLKSTAAITGGTFLGGVAGNTVSEGEAAETKQIVRYNPLGKTGLKMSDIAFGCGKLPSPSLAERAFDMGINYYDTAPDYGSSEIHLGKFLQKRKADRSKIIIASKICSFEPYPGHLPVGSSVQDIIKAVDGSLERLKTDYIDFLFVHAIAENKDDQKRIDDHNIPEAFNKLKKAGKIRFTAFSSHGPHNMENSVSKMIDTRHFDIMMVAYNFMKFPNLMPEIKKAHDKGMGIIAMKTLAGAEHTKLDQFKMDGQSFEQAALRWATGNKLLSGAVITIKNVQQLRNFVAVSGTQLSSNDQNILDYYAKTFDKKVCRIGCGECLDSCREGVNIAEILRYNIYFENYEGHEDVAMNKYNALTKNASTCEDCETASCEKGCPFGLPVRHLLSKAHYNMVLT
ncbi:MAG: aldo/keto reductase [Nitrospinae bacterium]|nr:aldo/keto reductase [Nitrospinota bacterium]